MGDHMLWFIGTGALGVETAAVDLSRPQLRLLLTISRRLWTPRLPERAPRVVCATDHRERRFERFGMHPGSLDI